MSPERLHYELVHGLLEDGACPSNAELARRMEIAENDVARLLRELEAIHGVVLHPHVCEPWIVHPFSLTPTIHFVERTGRGWWAPCVWCAMGVAALAGGNVCIHTRIAGETEPLAIRVHGGQPEPSDLVVHFPIPPARAWDNVHQHCSMVLPFHSAAGIDEWSARHKLPKGEAVPLEQVARLARVWYGSHHHPDWHKWSMDEAQRIFSDAGLRSPFWHLDGGRGGRF